MSEGGEGEVAEVEQRGAKSGRLTEGPQRLRYATGFIQKQINHSWDLQADLHVKYNA